MRVLFFLVVFAAAFAASQAAEQQQTVVANPIRRVVTMLQMMAKKVAAEGEKEEELFEKFLCYCETAGGTLQKSIDDANTKIPQLESDIKEAGAEASQLAEDLKNHKQDRADAKAAIETATSIREKEAKEFAAESGESKSNIDALGRAIPAIEEGMGQVGGARGKLTEEQARVQAGRDAAKASGFGAFLQTPAAGVLRKLVINSESKSLTNFDRNLLASFLSMDAKAEDQYAPQSGEILGILKQLKDEMEKDLAEQIAEEEAAKAGYEELMAAKEKEIASATKAIEEKLQRQGDNGVRIAEMKNDLAETQEALEEDKQFIAHLEKNCDQKKKEWAERQKTRSEEILAIQETIKILNDDDALELFKKTLPGPTSSLLQVDTTAKEAKSEALALIKEAQKRSRSESLDLLSLMLSGKKVNFDKVIKMVDDMVALLKKEQTDDADKKEYCAKQFDTTEDKIKESERTISDLEAKLADTEEGIKTLNDEIQALKDGIFALDKQVVEATEQRKQENADYTDLMASDNAAKELIAFAKNRLNKFYNPKLYKPPPKRELTEEERITLNMGGTLAPTNPPAGIAGTGISALQREAPPPPPETFGAYSKKSQESNGVIGMMDMLVADLDAEMQEADVEEKDSQKEYEQFMNDSATKRAQDSKAIADKEGDVASLKEELQAANDSKKAEEKELLATRQYLADLHAECDWLMENFDLRKQARADEVEALKNAKAVLSGADFSLLQTKAKAVRQHLRH